MALALAELELETVELLPAREVMSGGRPRKQQCGCGYGYQDNDVNILSGNVLQVGLFNWNHQDF